MSGTYSVMIVEDETIISANLEKKINQLGYPLYVKHICKNGEEALNQLDIAPVDVVITDIKMPVMNGMQLIKELREKHGTIKTVILSGYSDFEYAKEGLKYQVKDYLLKPVQMEELQQAMSRILIELDRSRKVMMSDTASMPPAQLADNMKAYILANYRNDINLTDLAKEVGYSTEHLCRIFKKYNELSIVKYITALRLNESKQLLLSDLNLDIGVIGQMVGYTDSLYFSRVFKKGTGMYPSDFRRCNGVVQ